MGNKLNWDDFAPKFGTWASRIKPFFDAGGFDPIYKFLKFESRRGKKIAPLSSDTFRCFEKTDFDNLKVVMIGLAPYHTFRNGKPVADGLLMGCTKTGYLQPTLEKFYEALETEFHNGLDVHHNKNADVSYLAEQGVLMCNAALTTEKYKAGGHLSIWEPFMKFLFEEVLAGTGVPIIFLGREAAKLERYVMPFTWVFKLSHPASASYNKTDWDSKGAFKNVNKVINDNNGDVIRWLDDLPF